MNQKKFVRLPKNFTKITQTATKRALNNKS